MKELSDFCINKCEKNCCKNIDVLLTIEEVLEISINYKVDDFFEWKKFEGKKYPFLKKKENGECIFYENKICKINDGKPLICKFFPFYPKLKNGEFEIEVNKELDCPLVNEKFDILMKYLEENREYYIKEFKRFLRNLKWTNSKYLIF